MSDALMKFETIDRGQIEAIMRGEEPPPPSDWVELDDDNRSPPTPRHPKPGFG